MRNWQRAALGIGQFGGMVMRYEEAVSVYAKEGSTPILQGEAMDTEAALATVPMRNQQAVRQFWAYEGNSMRWHGAKRQVNHETFQAWLMQGHEQLGAELARRSEQWHRIKAETQAAMTAAVQPTPLAIQSLDRFDAAVSARRIEVEQDAQQSALNGG